MDGGRKKTELGREEEGDKSEGGEVGERHLLTILSDTLPGFVLLP